MVYGTSKTISKKPSNINPIAIIIDETFWGASIGNKLEATLSSLTKDNIGDDYKKASKLIVPILEQLPDGYLNIKDINKKANINASHLCRKALEESISYSRQRAIKPKINPKEIDDVISNLPDKSLIMFWRVLSTVLKGNEGVTPYLKKVTSAQGCLFHIGEKLNIHKDWKVKTLLLDATLSIGITKLYFSKVDTKVIECPMSNTTVTQTSDIPLSKMMMLPNPNRSKKKNAELTKNLAKLINILTVRLMTIDKSIQVVGYNETIKILLVTNLAIEKELLPALPKGIATMHFGATSGIDLYKNIPSIVIAGRLMLPVDVAETQASLLTGSLISSDNSEQVYSKQCRSAEVSKQLNKNAPSTQIIIHTQ